MEPEPASSCSASPPTKCVRINAVTQVLPSVAETLVWQKELRSVLLHLDCCQTMNSLKPLLQRGGRLAFLNMDISPPLHLNDVFDELKSFCEFTVAGESQQLHDAHTQPQDKNTLNNVNNWKKAVELRVAILLSTLKQISGTDPQVYHGVPNMEGGLNVLHLVVLHPKDAHFWQDCIRLSLLGHR